MPLLASRLFTKIRIDKTVMAVILNCVIAFLVWLSVGSTNFGSAGPAGSEDPVTTTSADDMPPDIIILDS